MGEFLGWGTCQGTSLPLSTVTSHPGHFSTQHSRVGAKAGEGLRPLPSLVTRLGNDLPRDSSPALRKEHEFF